MSGIYIPGMKMPKGCATCPYCDRAWKKPKCKAKSVQGRFMEQKLNLDRTRQKWCPLVPVPEHGRLIDADALPTYDKPIGKMMMFGGEYVYTQTAIDNAPTIIPADPAEEGEG